MKVRPAKIEDFPRMLEMLVDYGNSAPVECLRDADPGSEKRIFNIFANISLGGCLLLAVDEDDVAQGMLIAKIEPNTWAPFVNFLTELVFWVEPSHRQSGMGSALIKAYTEYGEKLVDAGLIEHYTMTVLWNSPDLHLERAGWTQFETTYIKGGI